MAMAQDHHHDHGVGYLHQCGVKIGWVGCVRALLYCPSKIGEGGLLVMSLKTANHIFFSLHIFLMSSLIHSISISSGGWKGRKPLILRIWASNV